MLGPGEARLGQVGLAQRRPRHALGVDRVGLAVACAPRRAPGHQLGRHAHEALAARQQVALEAAGDVAAVLDRDAGARGRGGAPRRAARRSRRRRCPPSVSARLRPLAASSGHGGVALHVRVDPDYDHVSSPLVGCNRCEWGPPADTTLAGASWPGSYQVTSATPRPSGGGGRKNLRSAREGRQMRLGSLRRRSRGYLRLQESHERESDTKMRLLGRASLDLDRLGSSPAPRPQAPVRLDAGAGAPVAMLSQFLPLLWRWAAYCCIRSYHERESARKAICLCPERRRSQPRERRARRGADSLRPLRHDGVSHATVSVASSAPSSAKATSCAASGGSGSALSPSLRAGRTVCRCSTPGAGRRCATRRP